MEKRCKCTNCDNVVVLPSIKFDLMNDYGWIVVECQKCRQHLVISTENPDETSPSSGGKKISSYDEDIYSINDVLAFNNDATIANEQIKVSLPPKQKAPYCYSSPSIHFCSCGKTLDGMAYALLKKHESELSKEYAGVMSCILAGQGDANQAIIKIDDVCNCGNPLQFFFAKEFKADSKPLNVEELDFVATNQTIEPHNINTLASKSDCLAVLGKFIARWNNVADQIVLGTPFIGTKYQNAETLANEWKWIFDRADARKTRLITRKSTLTQFKNKYPALGIDDVIWQKYDLEEKIIKGMKEKPNNVHAKFYAGFIGDKVELLSGSFNLVGGPSYEQISFEVVDKDSFVKKYLTPLKISLDITSFNPPVAYFNKEESRWVAYMSRTRKIFP